MNLHTESQRTSPHKYVKYIDSLLSSMNVTTLIMSKIQMLQNPIQQRVGMSNRSGTRIQTTNSYMELDNQCASMISQPPEFILDVLDLSDFHYTWCLLLFSKYIDHLNNFIMLNSKHVGENLLFNYIIDWAYSSDMFNKCEQSVKVQLLFLVNAELFFKMYLEVNPICDMLTTDNTNLNVLVNMTGLNFRDFLWRLNRILECVKWDTRICYSMILTVIRGYTVQHHKVHDVLGVYTESEHKHDVVLYDYYDFIQHVNSLCITHIQNRVKRVERMLVVLNKYLVQDISKHVLEYL